MLASGRPLSALGGSLAAVTAWSQSQSRPLAAVWHICAAAAAAQCGENYPLKIVARLDADSEIDGLVSTMFRLTPNTPLGK